MKALTRRLLALSVLACAACTTPRTELLVVADTDFSVPDEVDSIRIIAMDPGGTRMQADAPLGPGEPGLPRTLGLVPNSERLGPFRVIASARFMGAPVVVREAEVTMRSQETLVVRLHLTRNCQSQACGGGMTCEDGACRTIEVADDELQTFTGLIEQRAPVDGGPPATDAGCVSSDETCNGADDDCDGMTDEGFDLETDGAHCGRCDNVCNGNRTCCNGTCQRDC